MASSPRRIRPPVVLPRARHARQDNDLGHVSLDLDLSPTRPGANGVLGAGVQEAERANPGPPDRRRSEGAGAKFADGSIPPIKPPTRLAQSSSAPVKGGKSRRLLGRGIPVRSV